MKKYKVVLGILILSCMLFGCEKKEKFTIAKLESENVQSTEISEVTDDGEMDQDDVNQESDFDDPDQNETVDTKEKSEILPDTDQSTLIVHICGAVKYPGVYEFPLGERLYKAIERAGGFTENACEFYLNQAKPLVDGCKIYVPTVEEVDRLSEEEGLLDSFTDEELDNSTGSSKKEQSDGRININTATEAELITLPGIGAGKAEKIIEYRTNSGSFKKIEDIMNIEGIKEGMFEKIKDKIKV